MSNRLPIDVCAIIFTLLDMDDLISTAQVCKIWREHINATPSLWQHAHFHFKLSEDVTYGEYGQHRYTGTATAQHKPDTSLVQLRLQNRKLRTLHITADLDSFYECDPEVHIQSFVRGTLASLYRTADPQPLHLRLEGFYSDRIIDITRIILETRTIYSMDLGATGEQGNAAYLAETIPGTFDIKSLRIYPENGEPLAYRDEGTLPIPLHLKNAELVSSSDVKGLLALTMAVTQPETCERGDECMETYATELSIPASLRILEVKGGRWSLVNTETSLLESLVCNGIWGLITARSNLSWGELGLHSFRHLVHFRLSFEAWRSDPAEAIQWTDLTQVIRGAIGPTLETPCLQLPDRIGGIQFREYDEVWLDQTRTAKRLHNLTLSNYFPSTLKYLTEDPESVPPLRTVTLIGCHIYDEVLVSCLPDRLPHLEVFDVSGISFYKRLSAAKREDWLEAWRSAPAVEFRAPSALALVPQECEMEV